MPKETRKQILPGKYLKLIRTQSGVSSRSKKEKEP